MMSYNVYKSTPDGEHEVNQDKTERRSATRKKRGKQLRQQHVSVNEQKKEYIVHRNLLKT